MTRGKQKLLKKTETSQRHKRQTPRVWYSTGKRVEASRRWERSASLALKSSVASTPCLYPHQFIFVSTPSTRGIIFSICCRHLYISAPSHKWFHLLECTFLSCLLKKSPISLGKAISFLSLCFYSNLFLCLFRTKYHHFGHIFLH